ncbi:hypothetical protein ACIQ9E_10320 [Streptomyces sp. NPDC094448]|uniref:hypothetical protein n=1 Tax=Streptomyces sp. NPDC094448 TaxID=3366063 RepID=UPI00380B2899
MGPGPAGALLLFFGTDPESVGVGPESAGIFPRLLGGEFSLRGSGCTGADAGRGVRAVFIRSRFRRF